MATINLDAFGHNEVVDVSADKTLAEGDSGVVQNVTKTAVITLPSTVAGAAFIIRVGEQDITVTVKPATLDKIMGNGFTSADDKSLIFTKVPASSFVELAADGADGYFVRRIFGTATRQA